MAIFTPKKSSVELGVSRSWITVQKQDFLVFRVQACESAIIRLGPSREFPQAQTYEIEIGADGNKYCAIRKEIGTEDKVGLSTPFLC